MGSRLCVALGVALVGSCASAGQSSDDQGLGTDGGNGSGTQDAAVSPDACGDGDNDGVCNAADRCAGFPDSADADADTVADGCDQCPGVDDRPDVNTNSVPDCKEVQTATVNLKIVGANKWRGWYANSSPHATANDNTLTGQLGTTLYNSYFVFTLTGFSASVITSVTLELQMESFTSADASETLSVWDVTNTSTAVENGTTSAAIYDDLAMGNTYGNFVATSAMLNQTLSIPLNAKAATDATAKLNSDFVVGVHVDAVPGWVRFGDTTGQTNANTVNRLVVKYLP